MHSVDAGDCSLPKHPCHVTEHIIMLYNHPYSKFAAALASTAALLELVKSPDGM